MTGFITTAGNYTGQILELELRKYLNKIGKKGLRWDASEIFDLISDYGNASLSVQYIKKSRRIKNGYHVGHAFTAGMDIYEFYVVFNPTLGPLLEVFRTDDYESPLSRRHLTMTTAGQFRLF